MIQHDQLFHTIGRPGVRLLAACALLATLLPGTTKLRASDHIDSPSITQDRGSDLTDNYAFLDPNDNSQVVLIMSTQGFVVSGEHFGMAIFDHNIRYRFETRNRICSSMWLTKKD